MNSKFDKNPSNGRRVVPCVRTDGQTELMKLIVAFRNFENASKDEILVRTGKDKVYEKWEIIWTRARSRNMMMGEAEQRGVHQQCSGTVRCAGQLGHTKCLKNSYKILAGRGKQRGTWEI